MNFRDYSNVNNEVKENYKNERLFQTVPYVQIMRQKFANVSFFLPFFSILEKMNDFIDLSDPDTELPNIQHAFQCAEKARKDGQPEWFIFSLFIHDFGKLLFLQNDLKNGQSLLKQWGIVGDTFIVGCQIPNQIVFPEYNDLIKQQTQLGIYKKHCGLDNTFISYGHDEYLYQILHLCAF